MQEDAKVSEPVQPEYKKNPLFLPPGSIRALMALIVITAFVGICIYTENIEALAVIATMIAKDYFESKKVSR